jgi:hypothetical protein
MRRILDQLIIVDKNASIPLRVSQGTQERSNPNPKRFFLKVLKAPFYRVRHADGIPKGDDETESNGVLLTNFFPKRKEE